MVRYLPLIITVMLMIYCVVDIAQSPADDVRAMPRWLWMVAVIGLPLVGAVAWLVWGRPRRAQPTRRPIAPDDDPDFLRRLK